MVVHVSSESGCGCGVISMVQSLLRNAAVQRVCKSGHMGGGLVNQSGMGMLVGAGVLVPSVVRRAVSSEVKRSEAEWGVNFGTRCVWRSAGVSAVSVRRKACGDGLCMECMIGANSAAIAATPRPHQQE
eukprot:1476149-Rhodomonas_salina.3